MSDSRNIAWAALPLKQPTEDEATQEVLNNAHFEQTFNNGDEGVLLFDVHLKMQDMKDFLDKYPPNLRSLLKGRVLRFYQNPYYPTLHVVLSLVHHPVLTGSAHWLCIAQGLLASFEPEDVLLGRGGTYTDARHELETNMLPRIRLSQALYSWYEREGKYREL